MKRGEPLELRAGRGALTIAGVMLAAALAYSCGSSSTSVTRPSSARCPITLSGGGSTINASGGNGAVSISAARECVWSASTDAAWLAITSGTSGQGDGTINYAVASNPSPVVRRGALVIGDQRAEIAQAAAPCLFRLNPTAHSADAGGGESTVAVDTLEGCSWTATSNVSWIVVTNPQNTNGPGTVRLRIEANPGDARAGGLTIGGEAFVVSQNGAATPCAFGIAPDSQSLPASGGNAVIAVTARTGCGWTAASQASWISVASGASGTGNGTVNLVAAPNTGAARTGTVTIAGQIFTATQASGAPACSYGIAPTDVTAPAAGATGTVAVATQNGCGWTAISQAPWITVASGSSGTGNGTVHLTISANAGSARVGTVTIAGYAHTVSQSAPVTCSYSVDPAEQAVPAAGGTGSVTVSAQGGCAWTAVSQAEWITITEGSSGSAAGIVRLAFAANPGASRAGTVTIAGRTFTATQAAAAAPCSSTIDPVDRTVPAAGGTSAVAVATQAGCAWTAVSQAGWIVVSSGAAGTGAGSVELTVAPNDGAARVGTVIVAGHTHTVSQAAAAATCAYAIDPLARSVSNTETTGIVTVTSQSGCTWTAVSQASWITVTSGAAGSGNGTVELAVAANTGPARTGTVVVAGQTHTVSQAAAPAMCSISLMPSTQAVTAAGGDFDLQINTQPGCAWRASSSVRWIEILTDRRGTGSATLRYRVEANTGMTPRSGAIDIEGQLLNITQGAVEPADAAR